MASSSPSRLSSPSVLRVLLVSSLVSLTASLLPILTSAQSSPYCGGAGIDLTPLSVTSNPSLDLDLIYTDGSFWYGLHPCGVVNELFCPTPAAMMCEYGVTLAYNRADDMVWASYSAMNGSVTGVTMSVANGDKCQLSAGEESQPRSVTVHFVCDTGVQEGKMISVNRLNPCSTESFVRTRYACPSLGESADTGSHSSSITTQTIAIVVSVVCVLVLVALAVLCVMCRRWRAGQAVWVKANTNKLLDTSVDDTYKGELELSFSRV